MDNLGSTEMLTQKKKSHNALAVMEQPKFHLCSQRIYKASIICFWYSNICDLSILYVTP